MAKEPEKIGSLIHETLSRMGFAERLHRQEAVTKWGEIVGSKLAAETEALKIDGDTLVVKVYQAAWRHQLVFLKNDFLARLDTELGKDVIQDIRFI